MHPTTPHARPFLFQVADAPPHVHTHGVVCGQAAGQAMSPYKARLTLIDDPSATHLLKNLLEAAAFMQKSPNAVYDHWRREKPFNGWIIE